eukprot:m.240504 g.240504  ORF g.240504 m.240504 type:complete len:377 (-) comp23432_c0_seq1:23-1153(-)
MIWLLFVFFATIFWALADICNDASIEMHTPEGDEKPGAEHTGLSGEQSSFVNLLVTSLFVVIGYVAGFSQVPAMDELPGLMTCGCLHFVAYLLLLKAFEDASSTEITPLLQTSAVWVFLIQVANNILNAVFFHNQEVEFIRPLHLLAFLLIILGGFLPLAHGNIREMFTIEFWKTRVVLLCITSELLVAAYSVILHSATYNTEDTDDLVLSSNAEDNLFSAKFFIGSRTFAALFGAFFFAVVPSMRRSAQALIASPSLHRTAMVKAVGDGLSIAGLVVAAVPYGSFYEPAVINAAEGGLQQTNNLILAVLLFRCGFGRPVAYLRTKIISAGIVIVGLLLSSTSGELSFFFPSLDNSNSPPIVHVPHVSASELLGPA